MPRRRCSPTPPRRFASGWCWRASPSARLLDREQRATHGLAWFATYVEAVRQLAAYAERMQERGLLTEIEQLIVRIGLGEYWAQMQGGIPISQVEIVRPSDLGLSAAAVAARVAGRGRGADRHRQHRGKPRPAGRIDDREPWRHGRRLRPRRDAGSHPRGDAQVRRQRGDRPRPGLAPHQQLHPDGGHLADGRARRVRADHPRGVRRDGSRQGIDVRGLRGAVARLHRRRLARHPLGDRGRIDPRRRHRRSEAPLAAEARHRRGAADRGVHRAQHRLRSRLAEDARGALRRRLQGPRQQDLDHASGARRPDDLAGADQSERERLSRPVDAARREAARRRQDSVSGRRHDRHRDRGARLSRHEGIRDRVRRLRGEGRQPARRRRGAGLQAADGDVRIRAHPDRGPRHRRGPGGDGAGT